VLDGLKIEVDFVVNNAVLQYDVVALRDFPPERFAMMLRIVLETPFRIVRATLAGIYEKRDA
jgi:3-hydroxybutyrate dehydrogenase